MKALICPSLGPVENLKVMDIEPPAAGQGEVVVDVVGGAQLLRHPHHRGQIPAQARPALLARRRVFRPHRRARGRRQGLCDRRPCDGLIRLRGRARTDRQFRRTASLMCPTAFHSTRRPGSPIAYGTTIHALKQRGEMKPGETLVVLGASGGVGLAAVEIGRAMGARVIACASSDDKLAFARRYGADETINYATEDLRARLKDLTGAKGVDVVDDPVGGARRGAGAALARLEGAVPGDRLRLGRDSPPAAQRDPAQGLRHQRRLPGRVHRPGARGQPRQYVPIARLGAKWRYQRPHSRKICA